MCDGLMHHFAKWEKESEEGEKWKVFFGTDERFFLSFSSFFFVSLSLSLSLLLTRNKARPSLST